MSKEKIEKKQIEKYEDLIKEAYEMDYKAIYDDTTIIKKRNVIVIDGYVVPGIHRQHINFKEGNMHCYNERPIVPILDSMNIKLLIIEIFVNENDISTKMFYEEYEG